tara:strand:- start:8793 stop:9578 length:786 start_codon:yes stop_codon:yes gene_type:complete
MILIGDTLIAKPSAFEFVDFRAWTQRGSKNYRRFFEPYTVVKIGSYKIIFDGYDSVWELIDSFHNDLPRNPINAAMKGDTMDEGGWVPFTHELEAFAKESETKLITITLSKCNLSQLNLCGLGKSDVWLGKSVAKPKCTSDGLFTTSFSDKNGKRAVATSVVSTGSCAVVTQKVSDSRFFVTGIVSRGMRGCVRPRKGEFYENAKEAFQYASTLHRELRNIKTRKALTSETRFPLISGLRSQEADMIEHSHWQTILFESSE